MTAVVHLVWGPAGIAPFEAFLASYERVHAGLAHDLVLLFNGVSDLEPYRSRTRHLRVHEVVLPAPSLDLPAYLAAARVLPHRRLCLLNSYAVIRAPRWLALLSAALETPRAGVAAATGSWGSHRSFALSLLRLPNGYGDALGDRRAMAPAFRSVGTAPRIGRVRRLAKAALDLPREIAGYPGFPAPHVRTNAFVIERELLLSLRSGRIASKSAAYRFEGGTRGLTGQLRARGLEPLVVGRDGVALTHDAWPRADIFWQGTQRDLLVADNQTRAYASGGAKVREALSRYAWGSQARWC